MFGLTGQVKFLPVKVKLHWPDRWCKYCLQETVTVAMATAPNLEIYWCPSCLRYSAGRTEILDGAVKPVAEAN